MEIFLEVAQKEHIFYTALNIIVFAKGGPIVKCLNFHRAIFIATILNISSDLVKNYRLILIFLKECRGYLDGTISKAKV